jgi:hypothetical protein
MHERHSRALRKDFIGPLAKLDARRRISHWINTAKVGRTTTASTTSHQAGTFCTIHRDIVLSFPHHSSMGPSSARASASRAAVVCPRLALRFLACTAAVPYMPVWAISRPEFTALVKAA